MVPKLPGSLTSSKARINWLVSMSFGFGILKMAKALLGVFRKLICWSSLLVINTSFLALILKLSVVNSVCSTKLEFKSSFMVLMPSATKSPCNCLYFFCFKLLINFIWFLDKDDATADSYFKKYKENKNMETFSQRFVYLDFFN